MSLEGRIPVSLYFADLTRKKQIAVTALFEFQIIAADFILVSSLLLPAATRLIMRVSRYIVCIMCGSRVGGFALSPPWRGSVSLVSFALFYRVNGHFIVSFSLQ